MIRFLFLVFLVAFNSQMFAAGKDIKSYFDCSVFDTEDQIFQALPFPVSIHPSQQSSSKNYAMFGTEPTIVELQLFNESTIPPAIFCLKYLQKLVIKSFNGSIPAEIGLINSTLTYLEISIKDGNLSSSAQIDLPSELFDLIRLETLIINGRHVKTLPNTIGQLNQLQTLTLSGCGLETLPDTIGQLTKLQSLTLSGCGLETIPDTIGQLTKLQSLVLTTNQLTSLPMTMNQLQNLRLIDVSYNQLLNSLDALRGRKSLVVLRAMNCTIDHLPLNISGLSDLDLSNNRLVSLNGIETLQVRTGGSSFPKYVFSNNQIESIPASINQVALGELKLNSNNLTTLPIELLRIKSLGSLDVRKNLFSIEKREWLAGLARYARVNIDL